MHAEQDPAWVGVWPDDWPDTTEEVPTEGEAPPREPQEISPWVVALVALLLWGPLLGAAVRPYRYPD